MEGGNIHFQRCQVARKSLRIHPKEGIKKAEQSSNSTMNSDSQKTEKTEKIGSSSQTN